MSTGKKLTPKQERFVEEYLVDFNGAQAAIRAGYSKNTAKEMAYENLTKPHIMSAICKARQKLTKKVEITAERVLQERASLAFFNVLDLFNDDGTLKKFSEIDRRTAAALSAVEVIDIFNNDNKDETPSLSLLKKFKFHLKDKSLEALEKYLGMYEKDNAQKGEAGLKTAAEFMSELLKAVDGSNLGLPKPVGDDE